MKFAIITDSSAYLHFHKEDYTNLFILDVPVTIAGETYFEGKNLTSDSFYELMSQSKELPKTSQPSVAELEELLSTLSQEGYTHVIGLFLSSGISGFYQNIQYLKDEFEGLTVAFPDTKITSAPLGIMVENALTWAEAGWSFEAILSALENQIEKTSAFIMVDDLDHLVKGGRLSNAAALLGNLLSIKPILYFNDQGVIEVYEKVRTEKKAVKRLIEILQEKTSGGDYQVIVIHAHAPQKAEDFRKMLEENGIQGSIPIASFGSVIGTHLGEGAIAVGFTPIIKEN